MHKILFAVPIAAGLVGASWAGTTYYVGGESRDAYAQFVTRLDALTKLHVATESVNEGFLRSEAITVVKTSSAADSPVLARLRHDIEHSPVGLADGLRLGAARVVTTLETSGHDPVETPLVSEILAGFGGAEPFRMVSLVAFDGGTDHVLNTAAWEGEIGGMRARLGPARSAFGETPDGRLEGGGRWEGGEFSTADAAVTIAPVSDDFSLARLADGLFAGDYSVATDAVTIASPATGLQVVLGEVGGTSSTRLTDGLLESEATFSADAIQAPFGIDSLRFDVGVFGLDAEAYRRYDAAAGKLALTPDLAGGPDEMMGALIETVVPGSGVRYSLALANAGGVAEAAIETSFDGDGSADGRSSMRTMGDLARSLSGKATLAVDRAALELTPAAMLVDPAGLAPWVVADGARWRADIAFDDLAANVNGEPMPLDMLLGDALAMPLDYFTGPASTRD